MNEQEQRRRMLESPIPALVFKLSIPTIAGQMVTVLYNTADTFFVAQLSTAAVAAVGVVFSLMSIIQAVGYGVGMGASSIISRALGAKDSEEARRCANSALFEAVLFGALLMVGGLLGLQGLVRLLGSTESILPYACQYAAYILASAPLMCASFVLNNILRAEGQVTPAVIGLCTGSVLNIVLDPLLIFTFGMGISGAALATVIGQVVSFAMLLSCFLRGKSIIRLHPRYISKSPSYYAHIVHIGLPTVFRQGLASLATALMNTHAGLYGDAALAALTIANKVYLLVRNIVLGIGQGFQPVAGYNYGAHRNRRVRKAFTFSCQYGTVFCCLAAALLAWQAPAVIRWFRSDEDVVRIGTVALYYACAVMPFLAYSTFVNQMIQCLGFSRQATFLACCRQGVFYLPLIFLLPRLLGLTGVQLAQPMSDFLTYVISLPFQLWFFRRRLIVSENEPV